MSWTEERVERAKTWWHEGWSASEIARELGGVTRNAVIAKLHRAGVAKRDPETLRNNIRRLTWTPGQKPRAPRTPRPRKVPRQNNFAAVNAERKASAPKGPDLASVLAVHVIPPTARPWTARVFGECAFPVSGEGADTLSCCAPTDRTYCAGHHAIMYASSQTNENLKKATSARNLRRAA